MGNCFSPCCARDEEDHQPSSTAHSKHGSHVSPTSGKYNHTMYPKDGCGAPSSPSTASSTSLEAILDTEAHVLAEAGTYRTEDEEDFGEAPSPPTIATINSPEPDCIPALVMTMEDGCGALGFPFIASDKPTGLDFIPASPGILEDGCPGSPSISLSSESDMDTFDVYHTDYFSSKRKMENRGASSQQGSPSIAHMTKKNKSCDVAVSPHQAAKDQYEVDTYLTEQINTQIGVDFPDRMAIVDWMIRSHTKLPLTFQSLCVAVNILDQMISCTAMNMETCEIVAAASLITAAKVCQLDPSGLAEECQQTHSSGKLHTMEDILMQTLEYQVYTPTVYDYLNQRTQQRINALQVVTVEELTKCAVVKKAAEAIATICFIDAGLCLCHPKIQAVAYIAVAQYHLYPEDPINIWEYDFPEHIIQEWVMYTFNFLSANDEFLRSLLRPRC